MKGLVNSTRVIRHDMQLHSMFTYGPVIVMDRTPLGSGPREGNERVALKIFNPS